jgi:hypothetical protein
MLKKLNGNKLKEHIDNLEKNHLIDIMIDICTKLINDQNKEITYHQVKFILDKLKGN